MPAHIMIRRLSRRVNLTGYFLRDFFYIQRISFNASAVKKIVGRLDFILIALLNELPLNKKKTKTKTKAPKIWDMNLPILRDQY